MVKVDPYKKAAWHWLVKYGAACVAKDPKKPSFREIENYYGNCLDIDYDLTFAAQTDLREHGINYAASEDPASHVGAGFAGTFTSAELRFNYLGGVLVSNSGKSWYWGVHVEDEVSSFAGVLRLLRTEPSWEETIDGLARRLGGEQWSFGYTCKLPIKPVQMWEVVE